MFLTSEPCLHPVSVAFLIFITLLNIHHEHLSGHPLVTYYLGGIVGCWVFKYEITWLILGGEGIGYEAKESYVFKTFPLCLYGTHTPAAGVVQASTPDSGLS